MNLRRLNSLLIASVANLLIAAGTATAMPITALFESDPGGLNNVNLLNYDTLPDLQALNASGPSTSLSFASGISLSGLAHDGNQYTAIFESDPGGLNNVTLLTYDTLADLKALNASGPSTSLSFASGISLSGLAHDGNQYTAIFESDPGGLNNVNLLTYDTLADLKTLNASSSSTSLSFASGISLSGLAHDGNQFTAVFESDPGGLNNVNLLNYDTLADLKALNASSSSTSLNFASGISLTGLAAELSPVNAVPLPATLWMLLSGLFFMTWRRNS